MRDIQHCRIIIFHLRIINEIFLNRDFIILQLFLFSFLINNTTFFILLI